MSKVYFSSSDSLLTILKKIESLPEETLELQIPMDNIFWQNPVNKSLLEKVSLGQHKSLVWGENQTSSEKTTAPPSTQVSPPKKSRSHFWSFRKILALTFLVFAIFASISLAFIYYYLPKATISLTVEEKTLEKTETVKVASELNAVNEEESELPGKTLTVRESEEEPFAATGQETVGDQAQGAVSLQNWTSDQITFEAGTLLTVSSNQEGGGLKFVTTQKVIVPAQTVTRPEPAKEVREAGVVNVGIEAEKFGQQYNLPADTRFAVDNKDAESFIATNPSALSGGTTRQITVVSQDDLTRAEKQLSSKLFAQGKTDLESKLLGDQKLIGEVLENTILTKEASAKVGEEKNKFNLKLTTQTLGVAYSESELTSLMLKKLESLIPQGFIASGVDKIATVQSAQKDRQGQIEVSVKVKTLVIPNFNLDELKERLLGKSPPEAIEIISQNKQILDYKIETWPLLPKFLQALPHQAERLTIKLKTQ